MSWYGEPLEDIRVRVPKSLPPYIEDADIKNLLTAIGRKQSHKRSIDCDRMLVEMAWGTEMRRGELAALQKKDIKRNRKTLDVDYVYLYRVDEEGKIVEGKKIPVDLYAFDEFLS